jgi:hypothetical protein
VTGPVAGAHRFGFFGQATVPQMSTWIWIPAAAVLAFVAAAAFLRDSSDETTLTVMSFNIYGGGVNQDRPVDETVSVIE